jgi:hypothetical protein
MKPYISIAIFIFFVSAMQPTRVEAANSGDTCTAGQSGQVQVDQGTMIVCNGTTWNAAMQLSSTAGRVLFQIDNDAGTCTTAKVGRLRFNSAGSPDWYFCNGTTWIAF